MLKDLKPALIILVRFVVVYFVLFFSYQKYLNWCSPLGLDPYSRWIVRCVMWVQNFFGYPTNAIHYPEYQTEVFYIGKVFVTSMVEGCNAISIMILCISFVLAFYQGIKTLWFILGSLLFLWIVNVFRIVGINILYVEKPEWGESAHDYLFPAIIYGSVVIIWVIWMRIISKK